MKLFLLIICSFTILPVYGSLMGGRYCRNGSEETVVRLERAVDLAHQADVRLDNASKALNHVASDMKATLHGWFQSKNALDRYSDWDLESLANDDDQVLKKEFQTHLKAITHFEKSTLALDQVVKKLKTSVTNYKSAAKDIIDKKNKVFKALIECERSDPETG